MRRPAAESEALKARLYELVQRGLRISDIAEIFGIKPNTVSIYKSRMGLTRPKAPGGSKQKAPRYAQDDPKETIDMCLNCDRYVCYGWCPKIGYWGDDK